MHSVLNAGHAEATVHVRTPGCLSLWSGLRNSYLKVRSLIRGKGRIGGNANGRKDQRNAEKAEHPADHGR
jgi:hypothetical protein